MSHITAERSLEIFMALRERALENVHHRVEIYTLPISEQGIYPTWLEEGWIEFDDRQQGGYLGNYKLAKRYLAYGPGEERRMEPEERDTYVEAALLSIRDSAGTISVTEFARLTRKEGIYRLMEAGLVYVPDWKGTRYAHVLDKRVPGLG